MEGSSRALSPATVPTIARTGSDKKYFRKTGFLASFGPQNSEHEALGCHVW